MVFQKRAKKCSEQTFYIGNQAIDVVQDYTYLGTKITSSGNFKISLDHLKEKALMPFSVWDDTQILVN